VIGFIVAAALIALIILLVTVLKQQQIKITAGFKPLSGVCDNIENELTEQMAVDDWKQYLLNTKSKEAGTWNGLMNEEAKGYMYCFCNKMYFKNVTDGKARQAAVDFEFGKGKTGKALSRLAADSTRIPGTKTF